MSENTRSRAGDPYERGERKSLAGVAVKDADEGRVEAVFATFGVVDHDGDLTEPGAFEDGQPVRISAYGHGSWSGILPVGKGVIRATDTEAILEGEFFLNTQGGRDTFEMVKAMGDLQEWSYGFDVLDAEQVDENDEDADGSKARRILRKVRAFEVSPVLLGAGVDTRTVAVKHNQPLSEQADRVLGDVGELVRRVEAFGSQSTGRKEGRVLSSANRDRLTSLASSLQEAAAALRELLTDTDPGKSRDDLIREFARYQRHLANL